MNEVVNSLDHGKKFGKKSEFFLRTCFILDVIFGDTVECPSILP